VFESIAAMKNRLNTKADFAERLKGAMERKGWTMSQTARQASTYLGDDEKFGRAHVWGYVQGRSLPKLRYLEALSLALEVAPDELVPPESETTRAARELASPHERFSLASADNHSAKQPNEMIHLRDQGDGTARLEIAQRVPWETAIEILKLLRTG
jgi:transcriptional regulator with XRE-family HTH domain